MSIGLHCPVTVAGRKRGASDTFPDRGKGKMVHIDPELG